MTIESDLKVANDQMAILNTEVAAAFVGGKLNKAAIKRARAAANENKKMMANIRKALQAKVTEATLKAAGGNVNSGG